MAGREGQRKRAVRLDASREACQWGVATPLSGRAMSQRRDGNPDCPARNVDRAWLRLVARSIFTHILSPSAALACLRAGWLHSRAPLGLWGRNPLRSLQLKPREDPQSRVRNPDERGSAGHQCGLVRLSPAPEKPFPSNRCMAASLRGKESPPQGHAGQRDGVRSCEGYPISRRIRV